MAGFKNGALALKKKDIGVNADPNFINILVDTSNNLYTIDEFGVYRSIAGYNIVSSGSDISVVTSGGTKVLSLNSTGVVSGVYGNAVSVPQILVDDKGRILSAYNVPISSAGIGTVTSVFLSANPIFNVIGSPITNAGILELDLIGQAAGKFLAGPVSGTSATPTFRSIQYQDLPINSLSNSYLPLSGGTLTGVLTLLSGQNGLVSTNTVNQTSAASIRINNVSAGNGIIVNNTGSSGCGIYIQQLNTNTNSVGIYVYSNSPAPGIIVDGKISATQYFVQNGLSTQFLKANGTVDSTQYLPLSGGTLTGNLIGSNSAQVKFSKDIVPTTAVGNNNFLNSPIVSQTISNGNYSNVAGIGFHNIGINASMLYYDPISSNFMHNNNAGGIYTLWDSRNFNPGNYLPLSGGTLTGQLNGTNLRMAGDISAAGNLSWKSGTIIDYPTYPAYSMLYPSGVTPLAYNWSFGWDKTGLYTFVNAISSIFFSIQNVERFKITDSGVLVTGNVVKVGGTSAQFLKADGSVDTNSYTTTASVNRPSYEIVYGSGSGITSSPLFVILSNPILSNGIFIKTPNNSTASYIALQTNSNTSASWYFEKRDAADYGTTYGCFAIEDSTAGLSNVRFPVVIDSGSTGSIKFNRKIAFNYDTSAYGSYYVSNYSGGGMPAIITNQGNGTLWSLGLEFVGTGNGALRFSDFAYFGATYTTSIFDYAGKTNCLTIRGYSSPSYSGLCFGTGENYIGCLPTGVYFGSTYKDIYLQTPGTLNQETGHTKFGLVAYPDTYNFSNYNYATFYGTTQINRLKFVPTQIVGTHTINNTAESFILLDNSSGTVTVDDSASLGNVVYVYHVGGVNKTIASTVTGGIETSSLYANVNSFSIAAFQMWFGVKLSSGVNNGGWKFRMLGS